MQLGILTAPFADDSLEDVANWASSSGFTALEIACWPVAEGPVRRYAGTTHIDVAKLTAIQGSEIASQLMSKGLSVSGLGYYPNPLHPDASHRDVVLAHLKSVIDGAAKMGVSLVNTFCGGDASLHIDENWKRAQQIWPDVIKYARDKGVKIAFENCPMIFSRDEWPGGHNIAYSPYIWRRILGEWGDDVGMNFDPSHLVWQMIDQRRFVREFGAHMLHVHAKDLMIDHDGLYEHGIMSAGMGWQVPRMPGLGDVNWAHFFADLYRVGYDGPVIIEHEDRDFETDNERIKRGFLIARDTLQPFIR